MASACDRRWIQDDGHDAGRRHDEGVRSGHPVVGREQNAKSQQTSPLKLTLASDAAFENARRFKSYDDFEELGFHSTILIDKQGRIHWAQHGNGPFTDYKFLLSQLQRMNRSTNGSATSRN